MGAPLGINFFIPIEEALEKPRIMISEMQTKGGLERIPQREAERLLTRVLKFRRGDDQRQDPGDDVNTLLSLFPRVSIAEGYILDYVEIRESAAGWIRPYARKRGTPPVESLPPTIHLFDRDKIDGYSQAEEANALEVETLYRYLDYEKSPIGLFEYAFFVIELWSTNALWHAGEWLDSRPIFTKRRFDSCLARHPERESVSRPDNYGPLALLEGGGGKVKFLVYSQVGGSRIYYLDFTVFKDRRVEHCTGEIMANLGPGFVY